MQNKSAVLIFTVLLALATLYTLSFNYFSSQFENEAQVQGVYEAEQLLDAGQITDAQFDATAAKEAKDFLRAKETPPSSRSSARPTAKPRSAS